LANQRKNMFDKSNRYVSQLTIHLKLDDFDKSRPKFYSNGEGD
jgi:hypothetical protein